jgi:hypothetical protein
MHRNELWSGERISPSLLEKLRPSTQNHSIMATYRIHRTFEEISR